jgi:FMN phosphatase YigB (HAD superfamily)
MKETLLSRQAELRKGWTIGRTANGYSHYQAAVLKAMGISELFDRIVAPNDVNFAKPNPAIFAGIQGLVAHVGDTLYADVLGSRRAGLTTIWLASELPQPLRLVPAAQRSSHEILGPGEASGAQRGI